MQDPPSSPQGDAPASSEAIEVAWRRLGGGGLVSAAVMFAVLLVSLAVRDGLFQPIHRLLMLLVAALMVYFVLARRLNVTALSVAEQQLQVKHGPLPLRQRVVAPLSLIAGIRCDTHGRRLLLRTNAGEDVILLEDVPPALLTELAPAIKQQLGLPLV